MRRGFFAGTAVLIMAAFAAPPTFGQIEPDQFEPNNSIADATDIDCPFMSPVLNIADDDADIDFFRFEVGGDEEALVTATVNCDLPGLIPLDSLVAILDENGNFLGGNDDFGSLCSQLTLALAPGTYYVVVSSFPDFGLTGAGPKSSGNYVLSLECIQPIPMVAYRFGGGGSARDAQGNRATIRFDGSGTAPATDPFGPNSIEDFSDITTRGLNAYLYSTRTRIVWVGPPTRAAMIDFGGGFVSVVLDGFALVNGDLREVEIFADNTGSFGPGTFYDIFDITNFNDLFNGFGLTSRSSLSGSVEGTPE